MNLPFSFLILDPQKESFEAVKSCLQFEENDSVTHVADEANALSLLGKTSFDLIIANDKPERLKKIFRLVHESKKYLPLILITDRIKSPVLRKIFQIGAYSIPRRHLNTLPEVVRRAITAKRNYQKLNRSQQEQDSMLAEIHHRVKNNLAVITSMLQIQAMQSENPVLQDKLNITANRIKTMAEIHEELYHSNSLSQVKVDRQMEIVVPRIVNSLNRKQEIDIQIDCEPILLKIKSAVSFFLIVNEWITNIVKYAFESREDGRIVIKATEQKDQICCNIIDNGKGLPDEPAVLENKGIGFVLIKTLTRQLNGTHKFISKSSGCRFVLEFPRE